MISLDNLHLRDSGICWLCKKFCPRECATRDHVIPHSLGGPNAHHNLRLAHRECNEKRRNTELISRKERMKILVACQNNRCAVCRNVLDSTRMSLNVVDKSMYVKCSFKCSPPVKIPRQRKVVPQGPSIRADLFERQGGKCHDCDNPVEAKTLFKKKHVQDLPHSLENTYGVCGDCVHYAWMMANA